MARSRTDRSDLRRFGISLVVFGVAWLVAGLVWGEDIAVKLQETPTTTNGWLFLGWFVGGPPFVLTALCWWERKRISRKTRAFLSVLFPFWIGMSLFVLPARIEGADKQFGTGALVGIPLSFGWLWAIFATGLMAALAGVSVLVMSLTLEPARARELLGSRRARMVVERLWLVLLVVALGIALYGGKGEGIFNNGI